MAIAGLREGNAIVPYSQTTPRTKWIDFSSYISGDNIGTLEYAHVRFSADSADQWKMELKLAGTRVSSTNNETLSMTGVTIKATGTLNSQATINTYAGNTRVLSNAYGERSTSSIKIISPAAAWSALYGDVDLLLESEPTAYTTAANLEASTNATIYVEPASATKSGLVNLLDQTMGAGLKTFPDGIVVDTNTLVVDPVNHRVGLGTGSPYVDFEISKSVSGGPVTSRVKNTNATADSYAQHDVNNDVGKNLLMRVRSAATAGTIFGEPRGTTSELSANQGLAIGTLGATNLTLGTNNTAKVVIASNGDTTFNNAAIVERLYGANYNVQTSITGGTSLTIATLTNYQNYLVNACGINFQEYEFAYVSVGIGTMTIVSLAQAGRITLTFTGNDLKINNSTSTAFFRWNIIMIS